MQADEELCICFHVSWRKVANFIRIHRIRHASQLSECYGAGTGCGWCRKQMQRLTVAIQQCTTDPFEIERWLQEHGPKGHNHRDGRQRHIEEGKGTPPPGAESGGADRN